MGETDRCVKTTQDENDWRDGLNRLLCSNQITGYALLNSNGTVVFGFGYLKDGFMISTSAEDVSDDEKHDIVHAVLRVPPHNDEPSAYQESCDCTSVRIKGEKFVIVRHETSMVLAVSGKKRNSVSLHSCYAGVVVVTYGARYPLPLQAVLSVLA